MGTHPIFESDFDCLTESEIVKMDNKFTIQKVDSAKEIAEEAAAAAATKEEEPNETVLSGKSTRFTIENEKDSATSEDRQNDKTQMTYTHRTFGRDTVEVLPMEHYYRNADTVRTKLFRPTLSHLHDRNEQKTEELREEIADQKKQADEARRQDAEAPDATASKFGWIQGVFVRCLLNIWGVILFLRMSWIVGEAGVIYTCLIVGLATVVTVLTTISMSAICTNGVVRGGGAYFLISRSLGPEFGGAIGLIFSLANAVAVSMYTVGFAETVRDMLKASDNLMVSEAHDVRIIGSLTLLLLLGITQAGMAWESKAQVGLLFILLVSIVNYAIGCFLNREFDFAVSLNDTSELKFKQLNAEGHFNVRSDLLAENLWSDFSDSQNFFTCFSIFFPAATGILAGSNISGDLKDPSVAIPKGTFTAIGVTSISYMILAVLLGAHSSRTASGFYGQANDGSGVCDIYNAANGTACLDDYYGPGGFDCDNAYSSVACSSGWNYTIVDKCAASFNDAGMNCRFGLKGDYATMSKISAVPHLITAGIFAATLSSALACLVSAPKVFQALANDKVIPKIDWFAKPYGRDQEPRRAYALTFAIALGFVLIGELNLIAPVISNFFLASYCLINYSCFSASLAKSPGWRPSFTWYNKWCALFASFICVVIMFIADWVAALVTFACVAAVYKMIDIRSLDINWGSSGQAFTYQQALKYTAKLASVDDHVKNFRPQLLVLSGTPHERPELVKLASQMTHNLALCLFGDVHSSFKTIKESQMTNQAYLSTTGVKGIYKPTQARSFGEGAVQLMSAAGIGKLTPNVLLLGFMHSWKERAISDMCSYYNVIHDAFTYNMGVVILHAPTGLTKTPSKSQSQSNIAKSVTKSPKKTKKNEKLMSCCTGGGEDIELLPGGDELLFTGETKERVIDVYWLFDDGGLTLLLPYLLTLRKYWSKAKIRLFTPGREDQLERDQIQVSTLCAKFRISPTDVQILTTLNKKPSDESKARFKEMIRPFRVDVVEDENASANSKDDEIVDDVINEETLTKFAKKTNRQLRINELIKEHSASSDLVCVTLPMVRVGSCPAALYMAWLDAISHDLPPVLMLRGNQASVLTFYS